MPDETVVDDLPRAVDVVPEDQWKLVEDSPLGEDLSELRVDADDEDDPVLLRADGSAVDTWREGYPYDERMSRAGVRPRPSGCCRSSCSSCRTG